MTILPFAGGMLVMLMIGGFDLPATFAGMLIVQYGSASPESIMFGAAVVLLAKTRRFIYRIEEKE